MRSRSITVVTATYNRAALLKRCYESLCAQTDMEFRWLIIDDGSADGTWRQVMGWKLSAPFVIDLVIRDNGGKHRALNSAFSVGVDEWVIFLDSDDRLLPHAVHDIRAVLGSGAFKASGAIGLLGNVLDMNSREIIGQKVREGDVVSGPRLREHCGVTGDTFRVYRGDLFVSRRFPEFDGESFLPENVLFDQLDNEGAFWLIPPMVEVEYQPGGLSSQVWRLRHESPRGFAASLASSERVAARIRTRWKFRVQLALWRRRHPEVGEDMTGSGFGKWVAQFMAIGLQYTGRGRRAVGDPNPHDRV